MLWVILWLGEFALAVPEISDSFPIRLWYIETWYPQMGTALPPGRENQSDERPLSWYTLWFDKPVCQTWCEASESTTR